MTYMSHELTRFLSYLLLNEDIVLLAVTWKEMYPNHLQEKSLNVFSHESSWHVDSQFETTQRVIEATGVTYSVVFYMKEYKQDDQISKKNCNLREKSAFCYLSNLGRDNERKQCLKEIFVDYNNKTQLNASIALVKAHKNLRNIYVYGLFTTFELFGGLPQFEEYYLPGTLVILIAG